MLERDIEVHRERTMAFTSQRTSRTDIADSMEQSPDMTPYLAKGILEGNGGGL